MNQIRTTDVLNRLAAMHYRSLPMYLADARPWTRQAHEDAREVLQQIAADHLMVVNRLVPMILEEAGQVDLGEYSIEFTSQHDLSLDYLLRHLVDQQQRHIAAIQECVRQLDHDPLAKAVAREILGEAKGHLESLHELSEALTG